MRAAIRQGRRKLVAPFEPEQQGAGSSALSAGFRAKRCLFIGTVSEGALGAL
jgi:hypothetical protein